MGSLPSRSPGGRAPHGTPLVAAPHRPPADDPSSFRPSSSKYDFIKVRVWLGEAREHYYVLSRFLISRHLTATKVPQQKAVKIALDVKKLLVDKGRLDISQDELEAELFGLLNSRGYGQEYIERYRLFNTFFQQRRPLIILIAGTGCTGKSTLAQQLASRLNLPNVLQTDMLHELLRLGGSGLVPEESIWHRRLGPAGLLAEFESECRVVRQAVAGDLAKCLGDGKSLILEGLHLDPCLYLEEIGAAASAGGAVDRGGAGCPQGQPASLPVDADGEEDAGGAAMPAHLLQAGKLPETDCLPCGQSPAPLGGNSWRGSPVAFALEESPAPSGSHPSPTLWSSLQALPAARRTSPRVPGEQPPGEQPRYASALGVGAPGQPTPAVGAVVVPLVLRMCPEDQGILLPGWAAACGGDNLELCERLAAVQARLFSGRTAGVPVFDVRPAAFGEVLDALHDYVLGAIQLAASQPGGGCSEGRPTM